MLIFFATLLLTPTTCKTRLVANNNLGCRNLVLEILLKNAH
jgi:hypothetical protein